MRKILPDCSEKRTKLLYGKFGTVFAKLKLGFVATQRLIESQSPESLKKGAQLEMSDGTLLLTIAVVLVAAATVIAFGRSLFGKKQQNKRHSSLLQ